MNYLQSQHVVQLVAPHDGGTASTASAYLDLTYCAGEVELEIPFGAYTSCDSTSNIVLTVDASTAGSSNATEVPISFKYKYNTTQGADAFTDWAEASTTGISITPATDLSNPTYRLLVDPAIVAEQGADYRYIRVVFTCDGVLSFFHSVLARFVDRYGEQGAQST